MYKEDTLYNKLILASNEISKSSIRGNANYIIAGNKILKSQFYRVDRTLKLEKIFKII